MLSHRSHRTPIEPVAWVFDLSKMYSEKFMVAYAQTKDVR